MNKTLLVFGALAKSYPWSSAGSWQIQRELCDLFQAPGQECMGCQPEGSFQCLQAIFDG